MKKITLLVLCLFVNFGLQAQNFIGFLSDNYSGVNQVAYNPANIVGTPLKLDINLVGFGAFGSNDYYGINVFDATKDGYSFDLEAKTSPSNDNRANINIDALGPAFMFNLGKNSAIAMFTRARSFVNANEINGASMASIDDDTTDDFNLNEGDFSIVGNAWSEYGISYALALINKEHHVLKLGISLKYLQGLGGVYVVGEDVTFNYDANGTDLGGGETTGSFSSTGTLNYARFDDFDGDNYDYKKPKKAKGFGSDFGVTYVYRPKHTFDADSVYKKENYKLKIGLSVTDIGYIDYKDGLKEAYNITNTNVSEADFDNAEDVGAFLESFYNRSVSEKGFKIDLPTAMHFNLDWSLSSKWYLNLNSDISLMSKNRRTANRISGVASLTPRFETKWFSFYLPLSTVEKSGFRMGVGFRAGPLYVGSGSVISAFSSDNNQQADVYAGLKIPIYRGEKRIKDKDGDGIIDKLDDCPELSGPQENNGCPWSDKDGDTVLDNVDECPDEVGPFENNGCPWGDKDGDLILDNIDKCPDLFGPEANGGCPYPDTDGDGVLDKDDICIDEAGTVANKGCPEEVLKTLQTTLNDYARVILFDYGKSSIKAESHKVLGDIIAVLNTYPNAKFTVEGHTDSIGSYEINQKLSETRANAVRDYLVKNGVDASRLEAIGYGERRPIATNMYKHGRAKNRRVEINLVK